MSLAYDITLSNTLTDLYRRYADKTGRNDPFRHARIRRFPGGWSAREKISRAIGPHVDVWITSLRSPDNSSYTRPPCVIRSGR